MGEFCRLASKETFNFTTRLHFVQKGYVAANAAFSQQKNQETTLVLKTSPSSSIFLKFSRVMKEFDAFQDRFGTIHKH